MMFTLLDNKKGYAALIGLLVVVLLIAFLVYGGSFFSKKTPVELTEDYEGAKQAIEDINLQTKQDQEVIDKIIDGENSETVNKSLTINIEEDSVVSSPLKIEGTVDQEKESVFVELRKSDKTPLVGEEVKVRDNKYSVTLYFEFSSTKEGYVAVTDEEGTDLIERFVKLEEENE